MQAAAIQCDADTSPPAWVGERPVQLLARTDTRTLLMVANVGTARAWLHIGKHGAAGEGFPLDAATATATGSVLTLNAPCPINEVWAICAPGQSTNLVIIEGHRA